MSLNRPCLCFFVTFLALGIALLITSSAAQSARRGRAVVSNSRRVSSASRDFSSRGRTNNAGGRISSVRSVNRINSVRTVNRGTNARNLDNNSPNINARFSRRNRLSLRRSPSRVGNSPRRSLPRALPPVRSRSASLRSNRRASLPSRGVNRAALPAIASSPRRQRASRSRFRQRTQIRPTFVARRRQARRQIGRPIVARPRTGRRAFGFRGRRKFFPISTTDRQDFVASSSTSSPATTEFASTTGGQDFEPPTDPIVLPILTTESQASTTPRQDSPVTNGTLRVPDMISIGPLPATATTTESASTTVRQDVLPPTDPIVPPILITTESRENATTDGQSTVTQGDSTAGSSSSGTTITDHPTGTDLVTTTESTADASSPTLPTTSLPLSSTQTEPTTEADTSTVEMETLGTCPVVNDTCGDKPEFIDGSRGAEDLIDQIFQVLNFYRCLHGAMNLTYSQTLQDAAKTVAEHNAEIDMNVESDLLLGETLYYGNRAGRYVDGCKVVDDWYDQIDYYDFDNPGFSNHTKYFTQVVWRNTKEVGCGVEVTDWRGIYIACEYNPPGNIESEFAINVCEPDLSYYYDHYDDYYSTTTPP